MVYVQPKNQETTDLASISGTGPTGTTAGATPRDTVVAAPILYYANISSPNKLAEDNSPPRNPSSF